MPDTPPKPDPLNDNSVLAMVGKYSGLAMTLPATTLAGYIVGYLLDRWLGTGFLKVTCLLLGVAGGVIQLIRGLQKEL